MKPNCCKAPKNWKNIGIIIISLKYPVLFIPGDDENKFPVREVRRKYDKKQSCELKLLEIICFLSSKYWDGRGRGDGNYSWDA